MNSERQDILSRPPGLMGALTAGFNAVANSILVIALPVLFDLFLWFGPRLNVLAVFRPFLEAMPRLYRGMMSTEVIAQSQEFWYTLLTRLNLFALMRTFPLGVSSLLAGEMPLESPLGAPAVWSIDSFLLMVGVIFLLMLAGWLLGGLYFSHVAHTALTLPKWPGVHAVFQAMLLAAFWNVVLSVGLFASLTLVSIFGLRSPALGQVVLYLLLFFTLWTFVPIYFSLHGIFAFGMNAVQSVLNSLRLTRYTFPFTSFFLTVSLIISVGLRFLWLTPPAASWWRLVGILANDFIATALLAASFIYYRDVSLWLDKALKRFSTQTNSTSSLRQE